MAAVREHDYAKGDTIRGEGAEYLVLAVLGSGGMGAVYLVKDKNIGRTFVIKMLHRSLGHRPDIIERFETEARALGNLTHPSIIEIFQLSHTRDRHRMPFYVMEVLNGETLAQCIKRKGRLDVPHALGTTWKLLFTLSYIHGRGVLHRDVKPDNIFLHRDAGGKAIVKLLDFGILKLMAAAESPNLFIGTPRYCPPEQLRGTQVDARADLYSAGVTLFEALTGHLPFEDYGKSLEHMAPTVRVEAPLLTRHGDFPPALVAIVASALAKDPARRPKDAFTFATELRQLHKQIAPEDDDEQEHPTVEAVVAPAAHAREPSQITDYHVASPTAPDAIDMTSALREGEAKLAREAEAREAQPAAPPAAIVKEPANNPALVCLDATEPAPGPPKREVQRDAATALPRSRPDEGGPGSVRYVTREVPPPAQVAAPAAVAAPTPKAVVHRTVPMVPPKGVVRTTEPIVRTKAVVHATEPMLGRPGRFAAPSANDSPTPEPHAIDAPVAPPWRRRRAGLFASATREITRVARVVPIRGLLASLVVGGTVLSGGLFFLRDRGAASAGASQVAPDTATALPAARSASVPSSTPDSPPLAPSPTGSASIASVAAAPSSPAMAVPTTTSAARPSPRSPGAPTTPPVPTASPRRVPLRPSEVGFD